MPRLVRAALLVGLAMTTDIAVAQTIVFPGSGQAGQASAAPLGMRPGAAPGKSMSGMSSASPVRDRPHGTSYAAPLLVDPAYRRPLAGGQISAAGRDSSRVLVATPPINPALGSRQVAGDQALVELNPHVNPRLGRRRVQIASGRRLGGGGNFPSAEAITYDPRDLLDYRVKNLENPAQRNGP